VQQRHEEADGSCLAGSVRPEEAEDLSFLDLERDVVNAAFVAIALGQAVGFDDGCDLRFPLSPSA
jgi:hypothetical protein